MCWLTEEIYDIIRGIFDGRAHLGREYSAFYYYAKYVANEKIWVKMVWKEGLVWAAKKIFLVFNDLQETEKKVFIDQSYQFYRETGNNLKKLMREDKFDYGKLWVLEYFPGEPIEPPRNATSLYWSDMTSLKLRYKGHLVPPAWDDLDTSVQKVYIRKYYQKIEEYVTRYEEFVNKMTPNDLMIYIAYRNSLLEKYNLSKPKEVPNIGYGHPYSQCYMNQDENVEAEDSEPEIVNKIPEKRSIRKTNVLRNERVIDKLRGVRTVRPDPPNEEELLAEIQASDSDESSDSSEDESKIVWKNLRDYREQYDKVRWKRYLKNLSRYTYDINGIPDVVEILPKEQVTKKPHGFTLSKVLENAFKLDKIGNVSQRKPKKRVPKGIL